ncbi:MAG: hypothetical protein HUJ54_10515 [Erysipelotrichaceae bacterium]|nr:hypothetical protein [Erysipelotrichaceae bacterium]
MNEEINECKEERSGMEKLPLHIQVPAVSQTLDFMIPSTFKVKDAVELLADVIIDEYGLQGVNGPLQLFDKKDSLVLNPELTFEEQGILAGSHLMLL